MFVLRKLVMRKGSYVQYVSKITLVEFPGLTWTFVRTEELLFVRFETNSVKLSWENSANWGVNN